MIAASECLGGLISDPLILFVGHLELIVMSSGVDDCNYDY